MFAPPSARRNFFKSGPLTWNPGSAPDINLNMYIINVIADDESKIGLYEIEGDEKNELRKTTIWTWNNRCGT